MDLSPEERAVECSFEKITLDDLRRLGRIGLDTLEQRYKQLPHLRKAHADEFLCLALCQGAALHFVDGVNGIRDFDVWAFFRREGKAQFPYRTYWTVDFGDSKFGKAKQKLRFVGRPVDVLGRSISMRSNESPPEALLRYITTDSNKTPKLLREKAVVLLYPDRYIGNVLWRGSRN